MSRETHSGLQCPHCRTHLALVPAPGSPDPAAPPPAGIVIPPPILVREEYTPPPVAEVLAVYAGRSVDSTTAARGAARVRESMNRARNAATQRRSAQKAARRTSKSA
ncbi:hypothetical protein [Actinomadura macrotermitis]|uniref:Uncharacterized protein n=1 Tax=Actinomadura macrotermitis TaxID=2585200 RepID=A0A7K0BW22_9ACTN|nr:hypothetical protein [Actinomadura macrotermitis]MQY04884.1 hypothetical protein [Actinomadura macrotermitis]